MEFGYTLRFCRDPGLSAIAVAKSAVYQIQDSLPLHPFADQMDLLMVTHSLVTSRLDHRNMLYMVLLLKSFKISVSAEHNYKAPYWSKGAWPHHTPVNLTSLAACMFLSTIQALNCLRPRKYFRDCLPIPESIAGAMAFYCLGGSNPQLGLFCCDAWHWESFPPPSAPFFLTFQTPKRGMNSFLFLNRV